MSGVKVFLKRGLIGIAVLAIIAAGGGGFYFKSYLPNTVAPKSFPQIDGTIQLEGLDSPVNIYRDNMGIPHIYASTSHDLFFAQGYVHAQERFWQMDFYRHVGSGRTAEMFGTGAVDSDKFLKTLGWRQTSQKELDSMSAESKTILGDYAAGVNAYLKDHDGDAVSLEYAIIKLLSPAYKIEPWQPVDTVAWARALAWDLRANMDEEIQRAILLKTLTPEQVAELFPAYPSDHPVIVNKIGDGSSATVSTQSLAVDIPNETLAALQHNASLLDTVLGPLGDGVGSNSWVVSGNLSATGKPLLANDPHLGIGMPSIWYQVDMHCMPKSDACPYEFAGFSLAGAPGVLLGHNDRIAWGFTFAYEDVMDLFIEKVNPDNPNQYEVNGQWVDFETRTETINVTGGDPVQLSVRSTRHGPVISDTFGPLKDVGDPKDKEFVPFKERAGIQLPEQYVISLSWASLQTGNPIEAVLGFDKAQNWGQFREAASRFHSPGHNLTYADVDGNIGYQTSGDVPIRKKGDGTVPVPGWNSEYDWTGYIPFDELPYTFNPAEGYIASVNNKIVGNEYNHFLTADWDYGFRANRIVEMLKGAPGKIDIAYIQKMHGDDYDASAAMLVPVLLNVDLNDSHLDDVRALLKNWDYQAQADSAPAALYEVFWKHLLARTFNDDLPERYWASGGDRWFEVMRNLSADSAWWDDKSTKDVTETRDDVFAGAFKDAVTELEKTLGKDSATWKWGDLHGAVFRDGPLGESGIGLIENLFNRGPFPTSGGSSIVNANSWDATESYEVTSLPSMRAIYDLSNLDNSITVHTTGQSGHAYNKHYIDMAPLWANIQYYPMLWSQEQVIMKPEGHLVLQPK
jgi:penicillin G amidase